jgi:NADH-quinone oxidoreductase subunit D
MMMELNRISHLVCLATGGMELGALTAMTFGFRERELILDIFELVTGLRMNHAYIRPGGVAQDLPETDVEQNIPIHRSPLRSTVQGHLDLLVGQPIWMGAPSASATSTSPAAWPWGSPARSCAPRATRTTCARPSPTAATSVRVRRPRRHLDAYGRFLIRIEEMEQSLKIVEQASSRSRRAR